MRDLPQSLAAQIIEITHGQIIDKINFLKDKQQDFLFVLMSDLKPMKLLKGDILY